MAEGIGVTLSKDVWLYKKKEGASAAYKAGALAKGETIEVGGA